VRETNSGPDALHERTAPLMHAYGYARMRPLPARAGGLSTMSTFLALFYRLRCCLTPRAGAGNRPFALFGCSRCRPGCLGLAVRMIPRFKPTRAVA
jgi:hypothetical protein